MSTVFTSKVDSNHEIYLAATNNVVQKAKIWLNREALNVQFPCILMKTTEPRELKTPL